MRGLHIAHVEVVIGENAAADRAHHDRAVLHAQVVDGLCDHLVHDAVAAAGAEVRLVLQVFLALIALVEGPGPGLRDHVLRCRFSRHLPPAPLLALAA